MLVGTAAVLSMNMHAGPAPGRRDSVTGKRRFKFKAGGHLFIHTFRAAVSIEKFCGVSLPKAEANATKISKVQGHGATFLPCCFQGLQTNGTDSETLFSSGEKTPGCKDMWTNNIEKFGCKMWWNLNSSLHRNSYEHRNDGVIIMWWVKANNIQSAKNP